MIQQPLKPKKSSFIYIALLCSLLLHLGLVAAPLLRAPAPEPEPLKPVSITLNEYQLAPTQAEPEAKPVIAPVPTTPSIVNKKPSAKPITKPEPEAKPDPQTVAEATTEAATNDAQTNASPNDDATQKPLNADNNTEQNNLESAQNNASNQDEAEAHKNAQTSQNKTPKLTEKDIANNGNLIQPKSGTKPSFPSVAKLRYEGPWGATGDMSFERGGGRYHLTTTFNIPLYKMVFESTGLVEGKYFKPLRYTDKRKGKIYAQAVFDYDKQEIHYGKGAQPDKTEPLTHHAQDFFTLAWQMALNGGKLSEPMQVTNGKKVYLHSDFSPKGDRQYDSNEGKINVQVFRINKGEDGIEFAFAPDFANIPAQIILTDGGKTHQLRLIGITLDGVDYWQAIRRTRDR